MRLTELIDRLQDGPQQAVVLTADIVVSGERPLSADVFLVLAEQVPAGGGSGRFQFSYLRYDRRPTRWEFIVTGRVAK